MHDERDRLSLGKKKNSPTKLWFDDDRATVIHAKKRQVYWSYLDSWFTFSFVCADTCGKFVYSQSKYPLTKRYCDNQTF